MKQNKQLERTAVIKSTMGEMCIDFDWIIKGDVFYLLEPDGKRVPESGWFTAHTDARDGGLEVLRESK